MNGRNRNQGSTYHGQGQRNERNDYDRGYDQQNYGRRFEGDRVFEGQQRSTASEYPEYMDQENSYNRQPSSRADRHAQELTGRGQEDWSPANGTDYRSNRNYDHYSRSDRQNYQGRDESSWGRRQNSSDDSSFSTGRADYGQRDWERSSQGQQTAGRFSGVAPKGYRRSDERIKEDLCDALTQDQHIDASEIDLTVESGVVTLKGTVNERSMKRLAEDCAERIQGVNDVRNELRVQAESSTRNMKTSSDSMATSDGRSSDKNDTDTASTRGAKPGARSSTEGRNYQS